MVPQKPGNLFRLGLSHQAIAFYMRINKLGQLKTNSVSSLKNDKSLPTNDFRQNQNSTIVLDARAQHIMDYVEYPDNLPREVQYPRLSLEKNHGRFVNATPTTAGRNSALW